jgi:hypothetical protein
MSANSNRYADLEAKAAVVREELHTEVDKILHDVVNFKIHIQEKLEDHEIFVEEEVSNEIRSLEGRDEEDADGRAADSPMDEFNAQHGYADEDVDMKD